VLCGCNDTNKKNTVDKNFALFGSILSSSLSPGLSNTIPEKKASPHLLIIDQHIKVIKKKSNNATNPLWDQE
jgi:hypothetical protein